MQGTVSDLRSGKLSKKDGYIAVAMRFYPRGVSKSLMDEYRSDLAPDAALLKDFKKYQEEGHNEAFAKSHYEERFELSPQGLYNLRELSKRAETHRVYFVCQCEIGEMCHREILLLIAKREFQSPIGTVFHTYPTFFKKSLT